MNEALNQHNPEDHDLLEVDQADKKFLTEVVHDYSPKDKESLNEFSVTPGEYWGIATALACAKLGLPLGFERSNPTRPTELTMFGSSKDIDYWLHLTGYEHRIVRDNSAKSESRSGLYTLLENPVHGEIFEHIYALRTNTPLEDIIARDPMFERARVSQPATLFELIDHTGVKNLYDENPVHCLRLYLTRQLPHLKHLRKTIEFTKNWLDMQSASADESDEDLDKEIRSHIQQANKEMAEQRPFQEARLAYWQTEYDFTIGLILEGFKPYTLKEVLPFVEEYLITILAVHPELSPTNLQVDIPDEQARIKKMLHEIKTKENPDQN